MLAITEWVDSSETRRIHALSKRALKELIYTCFWWLLLLRHLLYSDSISAVWHSLRSSHYSPLVGILEYRSSWLLSSASSSFKLWALDDEWVSRVGASSSFPFFIFGSSGCSRSRSCFTGSITSFCGGTRFTTRFESCFFWNTLCSCSIILPGWCLTTRVSLSPSMLFSCYLMCACGFIFFVYLIHFFHASHGGFCSLLGSAGTLNVISGSGLFIQVGAGVVLGWVVHILFWFKINDNL